MTGKRQIRLIAMDLDGTLNNDKKQITKRTREALLNVQKRGIRLALVSGRPAKGLLRESTLLELEQYHGLHVSFNGGNITDATTNAVLYERRIPNALAVEALRHLEQFPVTAMVCDDVYLYASDINGYRVVSEAENNNLLVKEVTNLAEWIDFDPIKILISAPNEALVRYKEDIGRPWQRALSLVMSAPFYLEATMIDVSKGDALRRICLMMDIKKEEIMAFGDAPNDISMIEAAGWGVAMGNACEKLKRIASEITLSNNEDGIAHTLYRHGLLD